MRKRSKSASIADQCPTVQKFLTANAVDRFPGIQKLLETEHANQEPADGSSMLHRNGDLSVENNLTDAINVLTESIMSETSGGTMVVEGDSLPSVVNGMTGPDVDWPIVEDCGSVLGTPLVDGLNKVDGGHWADMMSASCDQLLNSTDEDELSEDSLSDYQLMPTPPCLSDEPDCVGIGGHQGSSSGSGFGANHDVKFDTNDFITPTSNAMWCDWPAENDLNSLLIFGP